MILELDIILLLYEYTYSYMDPRLLARLHSVADAAAPARIDFALVSKHVHPLGNVWRIAGSGLYRRQSAEISESTFGFSDEPQNSTIHIREG